MNPSQEKKFDDMYKTMLEMQGDMKVYRVQQSNQTAALLEVVKNVNKNTDDIENYKADRNKAIGVAWLGAALGGLTGLGGLVLSLFNKHP